MQFQARWARRRAFKWSYCLPDRRKCGFDPGDPFDIDLAGRTEGASVVGQRGPGQAFGVARLLGEPGGIEKVFPVGRVAGPSFCLSQ